MTNHADAPPQLPDITDEAADTPNWVPRLGVALCVLIVTWIIWQHGHATGNGTAGAPDADTIATQAP